MNILPNIEIRGLGLYLKEHNTIVVSDLQLGYEEDMVSKGILLPKFQFQDIKKQFKKILVGKNFSKIIINGDFKHEFGRINNQEWREAIRFMDILAKKCDELIFIKGNHDLMLGPIAEKRNIKIMDSLLLGDVFLVHGDKLIEIPKKAKTIVIGHEHPALSLRKHTRVEKYKCFLKGKYEGKNLIVLPSMNQITTGTDVLNEKIMSPYLSKKMDDFEAYVIEDKIYYFGKLLRI